MPKEPKRRLLKNPQGTWEASLDDVESERAQAGEIEPGDEAGGGGDKGLDAETGGGGYGGDAALEGHDEAIAQSERPLDAEIQGDPRTREGENYPSNAKAVDERQGPIGSEPAEDDEDFTV